jgi:hypothetical protein
VTEYEQAPGMMFIHGIRFSCPCGNNSFKVEIGQDPPRYWCTCGEMYTEDVVIAMHNGE